MTNYGALTAFVLTAGCLTAAMGMAPRSAAAESAASAPVTRELERGFKLKGEMRAPEAILAFEGVLKTDPGNHAALTELGYLHAGLKHGKEAVRYLGAASAQDPENMRLHMDLAYACQAMKLTRRAEEEFRIVASHTGEFRGQAQEALREINAAASAAAGAEPRQRRLREKGYAALKRGDKGGARKAFEAARANNPKDALVLKQLGFLNLDEGRLAQAAADFEASRAIDPDDGFVALQLGYTYARLDKKELAHDAFVAASASKDEKVQGAAQKAMLAASPL